MRTVGRTFIAVLVVALAGCASGPINMAIPSYTIADSPATKAGVTVTAEYYGFERVQEASIRKDRAAESEWAVEAAYLPDGERWRGDTWIYPANGSDFASIEQTVFKIVVKNDTDHILRMNDARIMLALADETVPAMSRAEWIASLTPDKWRPVSERCIRKVKVLNEVGAEVMPGYTLKGYVVFNAPPRQAANGTLTFFDITTRVDAAGHPVEKQRFDFRLNPRTVHLTVQ